MKTVTELFPRGLIVSCQARMDEPLRDSGVMARMAVAAKQGGAIGIRANTPLDIAAIRAAVDLPIIGIYKMDIPGVEVFITPTFFSAAEIARAGSDMIAVDATARSRPEGESLERLVGRIHDELGLPVMADVSTFDEGVAAAKAGCDCVSSTLSGYTPYSPKLDGPDYELVTRLLAAGVGPVIAEGRYHAPDDAARALELGAHAVVVGGAITRPQEITVRFAARMAKALA